MSEKLNFHRRKLDALCLLFSRGVEKHRRNGITISSPIKVTNYVSISLLYIYFLLFTYLNILIIVSKFRLFHKITESI